MKDDCKISVGKETICHTELHDFNRTELIMSKMNVKDFYEY